MTARDLHPDPEKLVFVGGLHRSGTSLLHRCIGDHPATSTFSDTGVMEDEGQLLQSVYPPAADHGGPGRFGFDPASSLTEASPLATPSHARALLDQWSPYWDLSKERLVEKSPPNLVRTRFLQALFPGAYFVVVLRHPVAVSFATAKWSRTRLHQLVAHWVVCHQRLEADRPHVEKLLVVRYEELVADPQGTMAQVFDFLDLEPHPVDEPVRSGVNDKYFDRYRAMARGTLKQRAHQRYVQLRYGAAVRRFGYSLRPSELASGAPPGATV